jgi:hypothetical protein
MRKKCCGHYFQRRFWPARSPEVRLRRRGMPAVRCLRNPRAFLKYHIERYGNIAHLWSSYALHSDGKQVARGINGIQAIKEAGGWRVTSILVQAESATAPLPKEYLP